MKKQIVYYIALMTLLTVACMEDKGTYDYKEMAEIRMDTLSNRTIEIYDTLKVDPQITDFPNPERLTYCWYLYTGDELKVDTLSKQRQLNIKISLSVGKYTIYLKVTDPETGLSTKDKFILSVEGKFAKGLMILGQVDGVTNLQFLNSAGNITEICGNENAITIGENPILVANASSDISYLKDMLILCRDSRGGATLSGADLTKSGDYAQQFFLTPEVIKPQAYYKGVDMGSGYGAMADFIISDGKLHTRLLGAAEQLGNKTAFNPVISGDYELSPWAIVNGKGYLFYDNKAQRFLSIQGNMMNLNRSFSSLTTSSGDLNPSEVGMELLYMAEGTPKGAVKRGFGIFKDKQGKIYRLIFTLGDFRGGRQPLNLLDKDLVVTSASNIVSATGYAMSLAKPFLFYAHGSKIYQYELETNQVIEIFDINKEIPNSLIDALYIEYSPYWDGFGATNATYNNTLYVSSSTSDKTGKNGSLHVLKLKENGTVEEITATYKNCCGKTVSMCYKR